MKLSHAFKKKVQINEAESFFEWIQKTSDKKDFKNNFTEQLFFRTSFLTQDH